VRVVAQELVEIFRGPARTPGRVMIVYRAEDWAGPIEAKEGAAVGPITWADLERGSFGDFHRVFRQAFNLHEVFVQSLAPLLRRILAGTEMDQAALEDLAAERFNISIGDAIRLVCGAVVSGVLVRGTPPSMLRSA
jgi:hypothetical protein